MTNPPPPLPRMLDPRLAKVLAHPTRNQIMCVAGTRPVSPKEIALQLGDTNSNVSHHFKILLAMDCIELVEERPAAGGRTVEHFYRAKVNQWFDQDAWDQLDEKTKAEYVVPILRLQSDDLAAAILANTLQHPDDGHLTRLPMVVNQDGWNEVKEILSETLDRLLDLRDRQMEEVDPAVPGTMAVKVQIHQFRSPDSDKYLPPEGRVGQAVGTSSSSDESGPPLPP